MKAQRPALKPQNTALARSLVLLDFLQEVAFGTRYATLEEVVYAQEQLDWLLPDVDDDRPT